MSVWKEDVYFLTELEKKQRSMWIDGAEVKCFVVKVPTDLPSDLMKLDQDSECVSQLRSFCSDPLHMKMANVTWVTKSCWEFKLCMDEGSFGWDVWVHFIKCPNLLEIVTLKVKPFRRGE